MAVSIKKLVSFGVMVAVAGVVLFLAIPPGPSRESVQAAKAFCQSVPPQFTIPELVEMASVAANPSVKADVVATDKVLLRVGLCHCVSTFSDTKVTTGPVVCNG